MPGEPARTPAVDHYGAQYGHFASPLYADIRAAAFGEDIGQDSWLTAEEQDLLISWLGLTPEAILLDVACGSGGPALRIARTTRCRLYGVDAHPQAIEQARARAVAERLEQRTQFQRIDAAARLPYADATFDAVSCVDAVNHLPDRPRVFGDWHRLLRPGGRLVFTDPIVVTGPLTNEEIAIRSSIGFFLFVPAGADELMLHGAGFEVVRVEDRTENVAVTAARWRAAREARSAELRGVEGDATYEGQQCFLEVTARLAAERRLSRFAFHAVRR